MNIWFNSLLDWFKVRNYEENIHLVLKFNLDGVGHNHWVVSFMVLGLEFS